ncbi:outer membrane lipoprotein carrier protein LolA [Mucilaginibacter sp. UR6-11]|uniref:LolA family protein n=1 Tax=Mucilaginibacter sp. UR6-11 TaxID=1435644 RepID=UPI001E5BBA82|nr:outer membrane lipoprotein carrier protein LolA [Mucilaginibacter sp. UR6-11]MCC8425591.1 outer membrane lipoprotein carrier protein LolA [Mucilaginibacter sp. UR6-11]
MKKIILYALVILASTPALAQKDAQAKVILKQVSQKYRAYPVIKSDFSFTVDNPQAGVKETRNGTLITQSKTNKYKVTLYTAGSGKPDVEQEIINDGKSQWTYLKKDKEVQLSNADKSSEGFNPAQLFTIYEHGYKYLYTGDQKIGGKIYQAIDLSPESEKAQFFKIRLLIDKTKKQIYSALIFDRSGSRYTYTLRTFTASANVPEATFTFDTKAHPGVEVVNLK